MLVSLVEVIAVPFAPFLMALSKHAKPENAHSPRARMRKQESYHFWLPSLQTGLSKVINAKGSLIQQGDEVVLVREVSVSYAEAELW